MNKHDTDIAAKIAARDLIEALHGLNIYKASQILDSVELGVLNGYIYTADTVSKYRELLKGLPQGSAFHAISLARNIIFHHIEVDMNSEAAAMTFAVWKKEAALFGAGLAA